MSELYLERYGPMKLNWTSTMWS